MILRLLIVWLLVAVPAFGQGAGSVAVVPNVAALTNRPPSAVNPVVSVSGYRTNGDWGPARLFRYDATSTATVDNGCTFSTLTGTGRWKAQDCETVVDVAFFGARGDGTTDDTAALQAAAAATTSGRILRSAPGKVYRITDSVTVTNSGAQVDFGRSPLRSAVGSRKAALQIGPVARIVTGLSISLNSATNTFTVAAGTFAAGDMVLLYNSDESPTDYNPGLFAFVSGVSGTTVTLDRFPTSSFTAESAYRFVAAPDAVQVRNVVVDLSQATNGIGISAIGRGHLVESCRVVGSGTTNDTSYLGFELRGQAIVARGNYVSGILDAGNAVDRAGYGLFAAGDNVILEANDAQDCKHCVSTSERRAISPSIRIINNRIRQRPDWAALTDSNGSFLFLGALDVHANVLTAEIRGNDVLVGGRLALSLRNGDFDVLNNRVEVVAQSGLPFVQHGNGFGEAFISRAVIAGNTFIAPTNATQFYWDHSDYAAVGVHRRMLWQANTFIGAGITFADEDSGASNPFEDVTLIGNLFIRTNGTPLAVVGVVSNLVVSANIFRYGGTGNGITFAIPTNPPMGREVFVAGNAFIREAGGTGFDIDATQATNVVELGANRWSSSAYSYVGPVHGIAPAIPLVMTDGRDTYPRIVGTYDGDLKFGTGESQPVSAISLLYPGAIQSDAIWTIRTSNLEDPAFGTYLNSFSNFWNFVIRGDGVQAYRYSNEVAGAVMTPIVVGPRRYSDLTNGVWRITGNLAFTSNAVPILPEANTVTFNLENAAAKKLTLYWPDGTSGSLWHAGNDGSGSGLDADLLDGQSGSYYLDRGYHTGTQSYTTITGLGGLATVNDAASDGNYYARRNAAWSALGSLATVSDAPSDGSIYGRQNGAWASVAGSGGGLGTNAFVNGVLRQPFKLTNDPAATGGVVWITNGAGDVTAYATNLPAGSGGGLGTNAFVNGVLRQPLKLTNDPAATGGVVWITNGAGDVTAYATNLPTLAASQTWDGTNTFTKPITVPVVNTDTLTVSNAIDVPSGGTGTNTHPAESLLVGNGTNAVKHLVAAANRLAGWDGSGNSTSVVAGAGIAISGGVITATGTNASQIGVNATNVGSPNLTNGTEVAFAINGSNITPIVNLGSISTSKVDATFHAALVKDDVGLGTNAVVNGVLRQPFKLTNDSAATGGVVWITNGAGDLTAYATNLPPGGGGGTNILVNGTLVTQANLSNSTTVLLTVTGSAIRAIVTNGLGAGAYGNGFLPLHAGYSNMLTGDLWRRQTDDIREILWEDGTAWNAVGYRASSGQFAITEYNTNDATVLESFIVVDPTGATDDVITFPNSGFNNKVIFEADVDFQGTVTGIAGTGDVVTTADNVLTGVNQFTNAAGQVFSVPPRILGGRINAWTAPQMTPGTNATTQAQYRVLGDGVASLEFDGSTSEEISMLGLLGQDPDRGTFVTLTFASDDTANTVCWQAQWQLLTLRGIDTNLLSTAATWTSNIPGTARVPTNITIALSAPTGVVGSTNDFSKPYMLRITRLPGSDSSLSNAYLIGVDHRYGR